MNVFLKSFLSLLLFSVSLTVFGQQDSILPAYQRYPTLPPFQLFLADSSKYTKENVPKKRAVLLILFSPDCEHCQHETEQLVLKKDSLKNIFIVMATTLPIFKMKAFAEKYRLNEMTNVVVARDAYYFLPAFFEIHNLPYMALYGKKGKLLKTFEGTVGWEKVLATFEEAK